jgi:hypothetical protein
MHSSEAFDPAVSVITIERTAVTFDAPVEFLCSHGAAWVASG